MAQLKTIILVGAIATLAAAGAAMADETISYNYDAQGRLVRVLHNGTVNDNLSVNYIFDPTDSRTSVVVTNAPSPP